MRETRRAPDIGAAAVALAFASLGIFAVVESLSMTPLGAIFPLTVGGVLIGLSAVQLVLAFAGRGGGASGEGADTSREGLVRRVALIAIMLLWAIFFPLVGFVATSVVATIALLFVAEHERPSLATRLLQIGAVLVMVGIFYWLMVSVLFIPMPRGWLF